LLLDTTLERHGQTADTMNKQVMREFDVLRQALTGPAILSAFDAPWSPIYILVCFLIHPALGALALVGSLIVIVIAWRNERSTNVPLRRANEAANQAYVTQEQSLAGAEVVRALGMRKALVRRHLLQREDMLSLQSEASFSASGYIALSKFMRLALQSLALGLGAWLAIDDQISGGAIFAASFLVGRALAPIDQVVGAWRSVVQARSAYNTINAFLDTRQADVALTNLPAPLGRIAAEQLIVFNPAAEDPILAGISFVVEPGEVVAIIGPSGAGKSTLLRMLAGAGSPDRGTIRFDGADSNDWDAERLASFIGYLPQDVSLFAGTVKENISRFQNVIENDVQKIDAEVVEATQQCGAHDFILRLPNGYDTPLGWAGRGMSAGQAQRVGLARALFRNPLVILLDEPNAHLDVEGEAQLLNTLRQLKERKASIIVVAHRMGILSVVDKIMVLNNGRIEAFAGRDEVLKRLTPPEPGKQPQPQQAKG
jgi:ATP-binding cassette subfamily C protein